VVGVGTDDAPAVMPGQTIAGTDPIEFADLIQEGRETFRTVSREIVDVKEDVSTALVALTDTFETANVVITDVGRNAATYAAGDMPEPVVVPTNGEALGARFHARVALIYAIETGLTRDGAVPEEIAVEFAGGTP